MDIVDEEEPRVGDIKVGVAGDTQRLPDSLPMEDSYLEKEFFVRDCYPVYYDLIVNALYKQGMWCVTIIGAPGTGKSFFCAYFFERFRQERLDDDFTITVSTATKWGPMRAAAFRRGCPVRKTVGLASYEFLEKVIEDAGENVLHLSDGLPSYRPLYPTKFVCFTSPNEGWLRETRKVEVNATFYMPTWVPDELWAAATHLGYDSLTRAIVDDRFKKFGGVARERLAKDDAFVRIELGWLEATISYFVNDDEDTMTAMTGTATGKHHRLCHLVPFRDDPSRFKVQIAGLCFS